MASDCAGSVATECAKLLIIDKAKEYYSYITNYNENTENLQKKYDDLMNLKETINNIVESRAKKATSVTESWLADVTNIENDKELEELIDKAIRKGKDLCCYGSVRCNLYQRYKMSKTADAKTKKIEGIIHDKPDDSMITESVSRSGLRSRDELLRIILNNLQDDQVDAIGIVGMGAIGKTMLVKEIANHPAAGIMFDYIIMVEISDFPNVVRIQDQIAKGINKKLDGVGDERAKNLREALLHRPYFVNNVRRPNLGLVILDNVRKKVDLSKVGIPPHSRKCKVLVTSRESKVCIDMGISPGQIRKVEPLNNDEAKQLFRQVIGKHFVDEALEERLLEKCGGLPVSIVAFGNLMKNQEPSIWEHLAIQLEKPAVSNSPADITDDVDNSLLKTEEKERLLFLRLARLFPAVSNSPADITDDVDNILLKSEEKKERLPFLRLACLFPAGTSIPIEEIMRYGVGLDLFEHVYNLIEAIDQANIWVDQLKSSSFLFQDDDSKDHVKINDKVWASTISHAEKGGDMFMVEAFPWWRLPENCQKYYAISLMSGTDHSRLNKLNSDKLQILILDKTHPRDQFDDEFFQGMTNLKVVVLKGMEFVPGLPKSISGKLKMSLRTLHMEDCKLGDITGICELTNLLVLSLRGSTMEELPKDMGNLCKLRLLDLNDCEIRRNEIPANVLSKLSHLEGLYAFAGGVFPGGLFPVGVIPIGEFEWPMLTYNNNDCDDGEKSSEYASIIAELLDNLFYLKVLHLRLKFQQVPIHVGHQFVKGLDQFYISVEGAEKLRGYRGYKSRELRCYRFFRLQRSNNVRSVEKYNLIRELLKKTEMLHVKYMEELQNIFHDKDEFLNLQQLYVGDCKNMKFIFLEHGQLNNAEFPNLKQMTLEFLPELERVSGTKDQQGRPVLFNSKMTFPSLEELTLFGCGKIVQLWEVNCKQMTYYSSFTNLQRIDIDWCNKLEVFCSHSIATALVHLKELTIERCHQLKDVISSSKDETDIPKFGDHPHHIFPSLENVSIRKCDRLQMFIAGDKTQQVVEFSSLRTLKINNCPEMKSFASGPVEFSSLRTVDINSCPEMKSFASGSSKAHKLAKFQFYDGNFHFMSEIKDFNSFFEDRFQKAHNPSNQVKGS